MLRLKKTEQPISLDLDRKKVVYKFSICMEHFAALTSAKHHLRDLGLVANETAWSPVISLGELQMIDRFLDSEISFFHYLTRRATIEDLIEFDGDEMDLLSMYLTNGLWIDKDALGGKKILFLNADSMVRKRREPKVDRTQVRLHGVQLTPMWIAILKELYRDPKNRHRFDIILTILNQHPPALADMERRIRRWKRGKRMEGQDLIISRYEIGAQQFVLAVHLMERVSGAEEWRERSRNIARSSLASIGPMDCAVFMQLRNSEENTFDGVSFFRMEAKPRDQRPPPDGGSQAA